MSGRGTLHTFTIVHRGARNFPLASPYVMAIVALELVARRAAYPQALMKPYRPGER